MTAYGLALVVAAGLTVGADTVSSPAPLPVDPWPGPVSEIVYTPSGSRCSLAPAPGGFWSAAHCVDGQQPGDYLANMFRLRPGAIDPARDLVHFPASPAASPDLAVVEPGDVLEVRIVDREPMRLRVARWAVVGRAAGSLYHVDAPGGWAAVVACHAAGRYSYQGDSGAGAWLQSGALGAMVVASQESGDPRPPFPYDSDCGAAQLVILVGIP